MVYAVCGGIAMRPLKRKVSITLDKDVIGMIRRFSEKEDRSFSQCVNMLLQKERDSLQSAVYCDYAFCVYLRLPVQGTLHMWEDADR